MTFLKFVASVVAGLAIGYTLRPVPVHFTWLQSQYVRLDKTNPLFHLGGCLSWVYVVWFFFGPLAGVASQPAYEPGQPIDDLAFAEGLRAAFAIVGFLVAFVCGVSTLGWITGG